MNFDRKVDIANKLMNVLQKDISEIVELLPNKILDDLQKEKTITLLLRKIKSIVTMVLMELFIKNKIILREEYKNDKP